MATQKIKILIKKDGTRQLQALEGIQGENCRATTKDLEMALGDVASTENTKDYYEGGGIGDLAQEINNDK